MQEQLDLLENFCDMKHLKIKESKTNLMKFNTAKTLDFPPEVIVPGFKDNLEVVKETKLLGIILTDDLKWAANTDYICKRAYGKMWTLRRMKILDVDPLVILDVYLKEIRAVLELAVPAWHSGLTLRQISDIERVQKVAVAVILSDYRTGKTDYTYDMALALLEIEPLEVRRDKLCLKFSKKALKSRHSDMFKANTSEYFTRAKPKFLEPKCNTGRYYKSPLNYLTRLLNSN